MKFNDLSDLASKAMHKAFDRMVEMGADPALEAEDGDLTLLCEEGSATLCLAVHRHQVGSGEGSLSLFAMPGVGERWVAELVADCVVEVMTEALSMEDSDAD